MTKLQAMLMALREGDDAATTDALVEAAGDEHSALMRGLVQGDRPPEDPAALTAVVEAVGGDGQAALAAAREDGHTFDGDALDVEGVEIQAAHDGRLIEAKAVKGERRYQFVAIRPCEGGGPGARIYSREALQRSVEAGAFTGQPMFFNHEDIATIMKRGHGSRDPRDLAGWITGESWDGNYSEPTDAANGYERGAVLIEAKVRKATAELLDELPEAVKTSINMVPTKLRAKRRKDGKLGSAVEALKPQSGAVDLVTQAGAGGKYLARLRESPALGYAPGDAGQPEGTDLSDDALAALVGGRPELAARLREAPAPPDPTTEDPVTDITPEQFAAFAQTDAGKAAFASAVEATASSVIAEREDAIREEASAEARADTQRALDLRDMRDDAARAIEAAPILPDLHKQDLLGRYAIRPDGTPTPALDVFDALDGAGSVTKGKREVLLEAVAADIAHETEKLRAAFPTRVREIPTATPTGEGAQAAPDGGRAVEAGATGEGGGQPSYVDPLSAALGMDPEVVANYRRG